MANLVQRGSMVFGLATTVSTTFATSVDTSKSFIRSWVPVSGQTAPQVFQAAVNFTTTGASVNSITATRYTGTGTPTVYFEIISLDNIKVQHFPLVAFLSTDATINQTITAIAATNKAFALTNGVVNSATTSNAHGGWFGANISSTTNVALTRGATTSSAAQVSLQVIEFTDSTIVEHQTVTANATTVTTTLSNTIDPAKHFVVYSMRATGGVLDAFPQIYLSGTNTLNTNRNVITGATTTVEAYVVIPAGCVVEVDTGADLASTSNPITVANVTSTALAFTIPSWGNSGTGSAWASQTGEAVMISTTEVDLNIFAAGNTTPYALQTIQLPSTFLQQMTLTTMGIGN
jgi:hypothetical protein